MRQILYYVHGYHATSSEMWPILKISLNGTFQELTIPFRKKFEEESPLFAAQNLIDIKVIPYFNSELYKTAF